jgi:hypothetical protein
MSATDILGKIGETVGSEFNSFRVSLGNIYSTKVSLGNVASNVATNSSSISTLQSGTADFATKVSLGNAQTLLNNSINLKASKVSISNMLNGTTVFSDLSATRAEIGDLTVTGTTTTINTATLSVEDNIIEVNLQSDGSETAQTGGLEVNRGNGQDKAQVIWNDTSGLFQLKKGNVDADLNVGEVNAGKIKVGSGSDIIINNVSLGNYSSFETAFLANL